MILVWKYSRFARNRVDSALFKSLLNKHGVRVVSVTEPFEDSPTGRLMEGIIEVLDEFYSANQGQEVLRGMRESASRGFYVSSRAPYGYCRVKVNDGKKERATLRPDPATAPVVQRIFHNFLQAQGLKGVLQPLNADGIASPNGGTWNKTTVHKVLTNEAYTGILVLGKASGSGQESVPIRVEGAWKALVDWEIFDKVQELLHARSFKQTHPRCTVSHFLLSGLLRCATCGKAFTGQDAKSGKFAYYVCGTLIRQGAETCTAPYLPREQFEAGVVDKLKSHVLARGNLEQLVKMVAEEMDSASIQ